MPTKIHQSSLAIVSQQYKKHYDHGIIIFIINRYPLDNEGPYKFDELKPKFIQLNV